ncbi:MAG TPA: chitinase, partial [Micromonosporaceae bacterium]|nr:chitinase [Micromonosporaceae bacterium]
MQRKPLVNLIIAAVTGLAATGAAIAIAGSAASAVDHETCRPDGLYRTPGVLTPYCTAYDSNGRETMGSSHPRRVIGYFTSWRHGKDGRPSYLASNIPWDKVTHINYAFAHVDNQNKISVGTPSAANNPATNMTWPGVPGAEMDSAYSYTGHFNLLNKYKMANPNVKTLISVGGWAETGGYFDDAGARQDQGGFYRMTTNSSGGVNTSGINAFADSAVAFIRTYGFNGVDIDYEYPTSNADAGNPLDFAQANAKRAGLNASYLVLMKTLREKLDAAAAADGKYYMLTVAA